MQISKILRFASLFREAVDRPQLSPNFWIRFVQMSQRLGVDPYELAAVINNESGFNPAAQNVQGGRIIAQGLNQLIRGIATKTLGMSDELWENFSKLPPEEHLKWTEKFFRKFGKRLQGKSAGDIYLMNFGGFNNPDGSLYASKAVQEQYKATHPGAEFKNPNYQQKAIEQNPGLVENGRIMPSKIRQFAAKGAPPGIRAQIDAAVQATQGREPPPYEEPNPNWTGGQAQMPTSLQPQQMPQMPQMPQGQPVQNPYYAPVEPDELSAIENMIWFQ